ncbi:hypothetical protein TIFTF001_039708 [Ficus carica]|uniref:Secreted protein n=1 Tax=Ficus carica TaxID=3494 RepID=A0AA88EFX9_FICCA|nr:hypothetical protein TIFTF001_039708 [Ficus carica]
MLPNFGVMVLVMPFVRGVSLTPRVRSSNPGVDVVALFICDEIRCSICASNVLISSDIKLLIISSMFMVLGGMGHSDVAGRSSVERRAGVGFQVCSGVAWEPRGCEQSSSSLEDFPVKVPPDVHVRLPYESPT